MQPQLDIDMDEFFAAGERASIDSDVSEQPEPDPRLARKMTAEARARRAHLSRYVKLAVAASAGILLLGVTASKLRARPSDDVVVVRQVVHTTPAAVPAPSEETPAVVAVAESTADKVVADKVVEEKPVAPIAPVAVPEKPTMSAGQAKQAAKAALEQGANASAISSGEQAVVLDGADAEAWLVLGAAYQATGNAGRAKHCYSSCVSQGNKGPVGECRDMLSAL